MDHTKSYSRRLLMKGKLQTSSRPRLSGKVAASAVGRGKLEQTRQKVSYRTVLNTCLSFLNEVKNLAKDTGIKCSDLCTHPCPFCLAGSALPSAFGGSRQLRKKNS